MRGRGRQRASQALRGAPPTREAQAFRDPPADSAGWKHCPTNPLTGKQSRRTRRLDGREQPGRPAPRGLTTCLRFPVAACPAPALRVPGTRAGPVAARQPCRGVSLRAWTPRAHPQTQVRRAPFPAGTAGPDPGADRPLGPAFPLAADGRRCPSGTRLARLWAQPSPGLRGACPDAELQPGRGLSRCQCGLAAWPRGGRLSPASSSSSDRTRAGSSVSFVSGSHSCVPSGSLGKYFMRNPSALLKRETNNMYCI